jgi:hypothetical protein
VSEQGARNSSYKSGGFSLPRTLFPDLPVLEGIDVTASGASPCALLWVRIALVNHLNHQVAVQAHGRLTVDILFLYSLTHELDPPFLLLLAIAIQLPEMGTSKS